MLTSRCIVMWVHILSHERLYHRKTPSIHSDILQSGNDWALQHTLYIVSCKNNQYCIYSNIPVA